MKDFRQDFFKLLSKLKTGENFAFSRFSDGEMYILQNIETKLDKNLIKIGQRVENGPYKKDDFKHFDPNKHQKSREKLIDSFLYEQKNYYRGISCRCCVGQENFDWQLEQLGGDHETLTWANLWVNANYPLFVSNVLPQFYNKKVVFVCNKNANLSKFPFVVKDFRVGYNAMVNDWNVIDEMLEWVSENKIQNHVFLFSASSFTNIAIYDLYKKFPENTYIDIGTTLTPMMDMPADRDYLQGFWNYSPGRDIQRICVW
jgi:hypothetical protein